MYLNLAIKERNEIDIKSEEICELMSIKPSKMLGDIIKEVEFLIVYGKIENKKEAIIKYLSQRKEK
jgi:hypothetical protein